MLERVDLPKMGTNLLEQRAPNIFIESYHKHVSIWQWALRILVVLDTNRI